ncbi:hypothetical protein SUGI_1162680 [Cryptomeria japonica]|uniref:inositol-tetrakisphosphate 1-kinase 1 n=1 Tax=Cryptomeria japonica TaxID=3369 RepID=UPI0024149716|nr:inositol-tetrakisphosphate 1-kinase 1 [Cryptomeria japonica]GLJ54220.1 hypothetical protein SUGI_1162680 [Cryptomeria japonica]
MSEKLHYKIGYALSEKMHQNFLHPSLVELAESRGIDLVEVDSTKRLLDQGPFDAILQKLYDKQWNEQLKEYCEKYPHVVVIDPPEAIEKLHSRVSMLNGVEKLKAMDGNESVSVPLQIVVEKPEELTDLKVLEVLKFPVIAKALLANGTGKSHDMSLVFNSEGLKSLKPPLVLQEFVNHNGVIFKVYVAGDFVECVKRKSLCDISYEKMQSSAVDVMPFSQISNLAVDVEDHDEGMESEQAELPPARFIEDLASGLRDELGLSLFNFDLIRDSKARNQYFVIDINYFPGYAKMPGFEVVLTNFFCNLFHEKHKISVKEVSLGGREIEDKIPEKECSVGDGVTILATDVE